MMGDLEGFGGGSCMRCDTGLTLFQADFPYCCDLPTAWSFHRAWTFVLIPPSHSHCSTRLRLRRTYFNFRHTNTHISALSRHATRHTNTHTTQTQLAFVTVHRPRSSFIFVSCPPSTMAIMISTIISTYIPSFFSNLGLRRRFVRNSCVLYSLLLLLKPSIPPFEPPFTFTLHYGVLHLRSLSISFLGRMPHLPHRNNSLHISKTTRTLIFRATPLPTRNTATVRIQRVSFIASGTVHRRTHSTELYAALCN